MYGMPLAQALLFLTCVIAFILATQWRPFHPFLVLVVLAPVFRLHRRLSHVAAW